MATISIRDLARVSDFLDEINDPRRTEYGNIRHKLVDIIVTAFTAALCGYEDYEEMEEFGRLKLDFFKTFLELPNGLLGKRRCPRRPLLCRLGAALRASFEKKGGS